MFDRCPDCKSPTLFHAITYTNRIWRRWIECTRCGTLTSGDEYGNMPLKTKTPPHKNNLARDVDYEGLESERVRQDYIRLVPEV